MKSLKYITVITFLVIIFAACGKKEVLNITRPVGLGGDTATSTAIDKWIMDSLTIPYNIAAKYRWDPFNVSLFKTLTPTDEKNVIPLFSALKRVWIDPYNQETGSELFMKKYSPKQFVLVGSVEYDFYSVTLGQAEGGNNIVFFDVNQNYDKDSVSSIKRVIHTAHHEFGHILHQTVIYPQDFKGVSSKLGLPGYTATWFNVSDADALQQGYATGYSRSSSDEDFVEMISTMLTEGKQNWNIMKANANTTAQKALQQKEDFVVNYFQQVWKINFYSLQRKVQAALIALYPPVVKNLYGFRKSYTSSQVGLFTPFFKLPSTTQFPASPAFAALYDSVKVNFKKEIPSLTLRSFEVYFNSASTMNVYMYYNENNGVANASVPSDYGVYKYVAVRNSAGAYSFTFDGTDSSGNARAVSSDKLVKYFNNNFNIDWYELPSIEDYRTIKFTPVTLPNKWFSATLIP